MVKYKKIMRTDIGFTYNWVGNHVIFNVCLIYLKGNGITVNSALRIKVTFIKVSKSLYLYIACCPNCGAMFNEYIINSDSYESGIAPIIDKIINSKSEKKENGNELISFKMANKEFKLLFVQKHISDIRVAIKEENKREE